MAETLRKESLIAELASARDRLGGHSLAIRRRLSPAEQIKRSSRNHSAVLFGGAVLLGLLLSRLPARRKHVIIEAPDRHNKKRDPNKQASGAGQAAIAVTVLKFGLDLAKPALMRWVRDRVADYASKRSPTTPAPAATGLPPREAMGANLASTERNRPVAMAAAVP